MHSHLKSYHKEKAKEVQDKAMKVAADKVTAVKGLSDETVRGAKMVYSARTKQAKAELLYQVSWEVPRNVQCVFETRFYGILERLRRSAAVRPAQGPT